MGVKTSITLGDLAAVYPCTTLIPSRHGVSDSVYFTDRGVLKLFESASLESIQEERDLLLKLSPLPVSQPVSDIFFLRDRPCQMYEQLGGKSLEHADDSHIIQIAGFMRDFHQKSAGLTSSNPRLFDPLRLRSLIDQTGYPPLQKIFDSIDIELKCDGIIHGDLFMDNVLFENHRLSGVLDFIEACEGDFLFDLAIVAISWCLDGSSDRSKIDLLLAHYGDETSWEAFLPYMKYGLLYYATTRYLKALDYQMLLGKFDHLEKLSKGNR